MAERLCNVEFDLAADSSGARRPHEGRRRAQRVGIDPIPGAASSGSVRFVVKNNGTQPHELVVMESALAAESLPVTAGVGGSEVTVAADATVAGKTLPIEPGESVEIVADLAGGAHVLICNIAGHYEAGMFRGFTVTD